MGKKILLADDHAVVRSGLRTLLENAGYQVSSEAKNGEFVCRLWQEHHPDLGILDLNMPGIGGLETLQRVIAHDGNARLIIFSMHNDNIHAARAIQAGAKGYVVKTDAPEVLLEAVKQVLHGGRYIGHELAQHLAMDRFTPTKNPLEKLSSREFEVFRRIAEGVSLTGVAEQLHIGYKTAANIQTQVRQKLNVKTTGQLVHMAIRLGITQQWD